jgi:phosphoserine phosphatase RsbU/P
LKIKTKLLLLLILVSVIPIIAVGYSSFTSLENLGFQLAGESSDALLANAEVRLHELVEENGKIISLGTLQLDMAVRVQVVNAAKALTTSEFPKQNIFSVESFDAPLIAPIELVVLEMFDCHLIDGTIIECPVSYETQAIIRAEGVSDSIAELQAKQLQLMNPIYKALSMKPGAPALRYFTATVDGMGGTFPGHGGMPKGYDPRDREWFQQAINSDGLILHTLPQVDASTLRIMVAAVAPVYAEDGTLLGVTGAEKSVIDVLHEIVIPKEWSKDSIVRVVVPRNDKLVVIASQEMIGGSSNWNSGVETTFLSGPTDSYKTLIAELTSLKSGVMDYFDGDRDYVLAYAPIGEMNASLIVWVPHDVIAAEAIAEEKLLSKRTEQHAIAIMFISMATVVLVMFISLIVSRTVSKPIIQLSNATAAIAIGKFDVEVKNCGADEIGDLTRNFNAMIPKLKERLALQDSLEVAKQIQQCLLPSKNPEFPGWAIAGKSMYCDATGGDYYDFIPTESKNELRLVLGDVTGHGIASALMMATARSLLRGGLQCSDDPIQRLGYVNNALVEDTPLGWFMTFYSLELNAENNEVRWVSAGHDPAIVVDASGNVTELEGDDIPLGVNANWNFTGKGPQRIESGSVLVLGTDGIWEAWNEHQIEMFGKERLAQVISSNRTKTPEEICEAICHAVLTFCGSAPRTDDITLIVAKRL